MNLSSLSPSHDSGSPWVSLLGLAWLDHIWGHGPVFLVCLLVTLWSSMGTLRLPRSLKQGSGADVMFSWSTLWCGNPQRCYLLLMMKREELEARTQRTPATSSAHGHQAVNFSCFQPTPTCVPAGMAYSDTWLGVWYLGKVGCDLRIQVSTFQEGLF